MFILRNVVVRSVKQISKKGCNVLKLLKNVPYFLSSFVVLKPAGWGLNNVVGIMNEHTIIK